MNLYQVRQGAEGPWRGREPGGKGTGGLLITQGFEIEFILKTQLFGMHHLSGNLPINIFQPILFY